MSDTIVHCASTRFGFEYGAAHVERAASHKGHVVLFITTPKQRLHVRVTPTGLIRVEPIIPNRGTPLSVAI